MSLGYRSLESASLETKSGVKLVSQMCNLK
jgi:hypothetical protein